MLEFFLSSMITPINFLMFLILLQNSLINDIFDPIITLDENAMLTLCQTLQEVHGVIKSLKKWKAPGPDGYPNFLQAAWLIIHGVYRDICHFFNSRHLVKKFKHTLLFPIKKTKNVQTVNDF